VTGKERKEADVRVLSKLGEVLRRTGVVTKEQVEEAMTLAYYKQMRLGEAMLALGHVTPEQLEWALQLQQRLRSNDRTASQALAEMVNASMAGAKLALARVKLASA
jgi:hypothetical protein